MEKFKISDIQDIFVSDVERFHSLTQQHVQDLLDASSPSQESLDEALRQCHTLKGLAATVEAFGLSRLGEDFERLLELAGSWMHNEREKANEVFEFILEHMQDWYVMNQFSCMEMLPQAWDIYRGLRVIMEDRWSGYLPVAGAEAGVEAVDEQYVRLPDLEISEAEDSNAEVAAVVEMISSIETPAPELDVQGVVPVAGMIESAKLETPNVEAEISTGAPLPVRVVPPTLRHRDQTVAAVPAVEQSVSPTEAKLPDAAPAAAAGSVANAEQPATPKPLQVVPPALRRRAGGGITKTESAQPEATVAPTVAVIASATPATIAATAPAELSPPAALPPVSQAAVAPPTPPLLRVAPPALKRRGKISEPSHEAVTAAVPSPPVSLPVTPLVVEWGALPPPPVAPLAPDALSAPALFAALPEVTAPELPAAALTVEPAVGAAADTKSAGEFPPPANVDLLALLSQEVAGYLTELAGCLAALAENLSAAGPWELARRLFHTIKGTAATFGLDAVSQPARAAEARCVAVLGDGGEPLAGGAKLGDGKWQMGDGVGPNSHLLSANSQLPEAFGECVHRAGVVARALGLPFDEGRLRAALDQAVALAANVAVANAPVAGVVAVLEAEMAGFFINDTRDQLEVIEQAVLRWEQGGKPAEQVQAAQRGFHTIKGAGNSIGLTAVANSVHEVEAFLEGVAARGAVGSKAIFTFLLGAVDQLRGYLAELGQNTAAPWRQDWGETLQRLAEGAAGVAEPAAISGAANLAAPVAAALLVDGGEEAQTLRIETARLHQLMDLIGEMVIDRARLARKIEQLAALHRALAERNGALTGSVLTFQQQFEFNLMQEERAAGDGAAARAHGEFSELEFDRYDQFNVLARSLVEVSHDIEQLNQEVAACLESFAAENLQFAQSSRELQGRVTGLSLVPVKTLFPRLQRAFRDALTVEGKEADLVLAGGEALLDKVVVDKVYAPLLHLLRNAVAHGIEDAAARGQAKKPARGQVRLAAAQLSNQIVLVLSDDGAGVDVEAVRARAIAQGWLEAGVTELTAEQVQEFIFRPGFSTAAKVTSVAGRGIGLDVVRQEIENLNGSVELRSVAGQGATWTLRLPLSLAISEAIVTVVAGTQFAFPLNFVEAGLILEGATTRSEQGVELYPVERRPVHDAASGLVSEEAEEAPKFDLLPVFRLTRMFGLAGDEQANKGLIVGVGERRAIVVVDGVLGRQEVVVKELDVVMALHPLLNGATLDTEGRVVPILNLPTLLKYGELVRGGVGSGEVRLENVTRVEETRVLVVDDSLSVRKVQERYLRDLGCVVTVASDGLAALERLREGATAGLALPFDFIFTDLEMPRMNGYELISEVRGNPAWAKIPLVVISSRGADKYITKAMNLGANTFLTKPFTQQQLRQVLGHFAELAAKA